jgi:excisionase family DNA binding protein
MMRVVGGAQEPEAYVDRREMARRLGISVSLLDKMVARGEVPSVTWGRRTRRFLPSAVIRSLATRQQDAA